MLLVPEFSNQEIEAIEELRNRLKDDVKAEIYEDKLLFYRFLKARDFHLNNAENMMRKHLEWRKKNNIESLLKDYQVNEVLEKYLTYPVLGNAKDGCLVRYLALGKTDTRGFYLSIKYQDLERYIYYLLEKDAVRLEEQSIKLGRKVYKTIFIYDFKDLTFAQATDKKCLEFYIKAILAYQNNYPEQMKAAYVINTSLYFSLTFTVVKAFFSSSMLKKIHIFGADGWKEELLKVIDADELPAFLGGNKTDPDGNPMCISFINYGGKIPESYYIHKSKRTLSDLPGVKKVILSRASFHEESIFVEEPDSFLEWEFETKTRDVGFGLFLQEMTSGEEKMVELVPIQRIDTDEYTETGMYKCEKAGTYVILFDNTYSWFRSKEISFKTSVISPKDEVAQNLNYL